MKYFGSGARRRFILPAVTVGSTAVVLVTSFLVPNSVAEASPNLTSAEMAFLDSEEPITAGEDESITINVPGFSWGVKAGPDGIDILSVNQESSGQELNAFPLVGPTEDGGAVRLEPAFSGDKKTVKFDLEPIPVSETGRWLDSQRAPGPRGDVKAVTAIREIERPRGRDVERQISRQISSMKMLTVNSLGYRLAYAADLMHTLTPKLRQSTWTNQRQLWNSESVKQLRNQGYRQGQNLSPGYYAIVGAIIGAFVNPYSIPALVTSVVIVVGFPILLAILPILAIGWAGLFIFTIALFLSPTAAIGALIGSGIGSIPENRNNTGRAYSYYPESTGLAIAGLDSDNQEIASLSQDYLVAWRRSGLEGLIPLRWEGRPPSGQLPASALQISR